MKEFRRVQKVGHSTLSVSLPADWAKRRELKRGSAIFLYEESDGSLRLFIEPRKSEEDMVTIDADQYEDPVTLARVVVGSYVLGRNVIRIISVGRLRREQIENIRDVTQRLLGIGIVEESEKHVLLQSSINPASFPISTMMRRLYMIVSTMFKETRDGLRDEDTELVKDAISRKHEADTTYWLITRLLSSAQKSWVLARDIGINEPTEIIQNSLISRFLGMIGDHTETLAKKYLELRQHARDVSQEFINLLDQISSLAFTVIEKAMESTFTGDVKIASDAMKMSSVVELKEHEFLDLLQKRNDELEVAPSLRSILSEVKTITEYGSAISEIAIIKVLEKTA